MENQQSKYVIIVAGGSGERMSGILPKQFIVVGAKPILMHTILRFYNFDAKMNIIVVLPFEHIDTWNFLCSKYRFAVPHQIAPGGKERFDSVRNGLDKVSGDGLVAIHDGVRPLVSPQVIKSSFETADLFGGSIPVVSPSESLRYVENQLSKSVNRNDYRLVQTPQTFRSRLIKKAYNKPYEERFTDDAGVFEADGNTISLIEGNHENIKITWPSDIIYAEALLSNSGYQAGN